MPDTDPYFTPDPSPAPRRASPNYDEIIDRHATRTGIDPALIKAVMGQESGGSASAVSPKGARGPMQLMPATAKRFGVSNPHDPEQAIRGGTDYLKFLNDRYNGDTDKVLAGYNAGEGNVDKYGGIPPFRETRNYVPAVKARYAKLTGQSPKSGDDPYFTPDTEPSTTQTDPYFTPETQQLTGRGAGMARASQSQAPPIRRFGAGEVKPLARRPPITDVLDQGVAQINEMTRGLEQQAQGVKPTGTQAIFDRAQPSQPIRASQAAEVFNRGAVSPISSAIRANTVNTGVEAGKVRSVVKAAAPPGFALLPDAAQEWIGSAIAQGGSGLMTTAAGLIRNGVPPIAVARALGAPDPLLKPIADHFNAAAQQLGQGTQAMDRQTNRGRLSQAVKDVVGGGIATTPAMVLVSLGIPAPVAFGMQGSAEAQGRDAELSEVIKETTKGAAIGALFELPLPSKLAMAGQLGQRLGKAGLVGTGTKAIDLASGADPNDNTNAIVNALFAASGSPRKPMDVAPREASIAPVIADARAERVQQATEGARPLDLTDPKLARTALGTALAERGGASEQPIDSGINVPSETQRTVSTALESVSEPIRHVDEQIRRQRGEGKGQFKKETITQTADRRAKVEQASQPASEPKQLAPPATSQSPSVLPQGAAQVASMPENRVSERRVVKGEPPVDAGAVARRAQLQQERADVKGQSQAESQKFSLARHAGEDDEAALARVAATANRNRSVSIEYPGTWVLDKAFPDGSARVRHPEAPLGGGIKTKEWHFAEPRFRSFPHSTQVADWETGASREFASPDEAHAEARRLNANPPKDTAFIKIEDANVIEQQKYPHFYRASGGRINSRTPEGVAEIRARHEELKRNPPPGNDVINPRLDEIDRELSTLNTRGPERRVAERRALKRESVSPVEGVTAPSIPEVGKPWQMTRKEYALDQFNEAGFDTSRRYGGLGKNWPDKIDAEHKTIVERALQDGKDVPANVLADYPDLQKEASIEAPDVTPNAEDDQFLETGTLKSEPLQPETPKEPSTTSARKSQVAEDRASLDLPELPPAERKSWQTSLANAKPEKAGLLADEVLTKPRALNDEETASLVVRAQQIKNEHSQVMKEIGDATDSEEISAKRSQAEALEREFDRLTTATKASGTEKGRALASQKLTINRDFDLISVKQRMKAAKGRELTPEEVKKYEGMVKERDQAILDRDAALERAHTAELQKQINKSTRQRARAETKEALDTEAATIKTNIAAEFARLKSAQSSVHSAFGLGSLDPEGVITKELLKYARNRVKANVGLKAEELIDEVHDLVKDFGASRRQVAEALSGYMKPRDTRETDQATKQLADIRKEIKGLLIKEDVAAGTQTKTAQGPSKRFVSRNTTRLKQLQAKEADLAARMAAGDYSPRVKPEPLPYNREVNAAQIRVKQIERAFNEEAAKRAPQTIGDFLVRWKRFAVLGFPSTIGKLGSAATGRMAMTPLYELVGEGMRRTPGLKSVYQDVPRATLAGERAAISQLWQSESFKDVLRQLKGGDDMISLLYSEAGGDEFVQRSSSGRSLVPKSFDELLDRPGHLHAAIKVIPKRAAIFRTFENLLRNEQTKTNGRDVSDPAVQMALMAEAYPEAQRAVLQQRNPVSSLFNRVIHAAATSESRLARGAGKALQFQYPITKVPVNFVGESLTHIAGLPAGLGEVAVRGVSGRAKRLMGAEDRPAMMQKLASRLPDAIGDLKPEERARIARSLKVGGVGLGFVVWGMMRPDQFGGYYQPGKRDPKDVKAAGMRFMGINIPRWMGHIPPLEAAQFGATLRRVYDSMAEKGKSKTEAVKEAGIAGTKGMAEEIPFVDPLINSAHGVGALLGKEGERTKFLGGEAVAMVPGALRQGAKTLDYPEGGTLAGALNPFGSQEPVKREEKTIGQIVKGGVPGLRQTVPEKNSSGKLLESRAGNDPLARELMRIDKQVNGVSKADEETQADFEKRRAVVNPKIAADLKALVDSREYKKLSDDDKKQQIKMHVSTVTKQANENYQLQNGGAKPKPLRQVYIAPQPTPRTVAP